MTAVKDAGWQEVIDAVKKLDNLLKATWNKDEEAVAKGIEEAHFETSNISIKEQPFVSKLAQSVFLYCCCSE